MCSTTEGWFNDRLRIYIQPASIVSQGVKENAIELIADIMKRFGDDIETVRAAVTSLAALTSFLSRYIETTIDSRTSRVLLRLN
jgi:hypothetical protein